MLSLEVTQHTIHCFWLLAAVVPRSDIFEVPDDQDQHEELLNCFRCTGFIFVLAHLGMIPCQGATAVL